MADTNVWARAQLNDDPVQARKARKVLSDAMAGAGVFVPLLVLAELAWVLRGVWERERVLRMMENMLQALGVAVEAPALVRAAIDSARQGAGGFTDQLIAQVGLAHGATEVMTFDARFGKGNRVRQLK